MRAGTLRHRLQIQAVAGEPNSFGEPSKVWATTATVWGSVNPLSGRERFTAQQVQSDVTHTITVRARTLSPANRIAFVQNGTTRLFNILEVLRKDERRIALTLMCQEEVA